MSFLSPNRHAANTTAPPRWTLVLACVLLSPPCTCTCLANDLTTVVEIVKTQCSECHNSETKEGGLDLTSSGTNLNDSQQ